MKKMLILVVVMLLIGITPVSAAKPSLKLPFPNGESWLLTRAYNNQTHVGDDYYALDFTLGGCGSWDKPILAVAGGTVETQTYDPDGYGNNLLVNHGDGYKSRYAHLKSISVTNGQVVSQGQELGRCGNTGNVSGTSCAEHPGVHIHLALYRYGNAEIMEPMSGYSDFNDHIMSTFTSNNSGNSYACQWISQSPDGAITLTPGETHTFVVTFKNTGTTAWSNSANINDPDMCELRSCYVNGNVTPSWLYPGDGIWNSNTGNRVVCASTAVQPQANGTFTFTGKVPSNATPGTYNVYFRPFHETGGYLSGWQSTHFQLSVVQTSTPPSSPIFQPIAGDFNGDGTSDVGLYDAQAGNWYVAVSNGSNAFAPTPSPNGQWMAGIGVGVGVFQRLVGDFNGDGKSDVGLYVPSTGTWHVALSTGSAFSFQSPPWLNGVGIGAGLFQPLVGDFNGDGKDDVCIYVLSTGTWYVCLSNGTSTFVFQANPWMNGIGVGAAGVFQPLVGDFNADGKDDICLYVAQSGTWYACLSNGSTAFSFQATPWMNGVGVGAGVFQPLEGDFNSDAKSDVGLYVPSTGTWHVALSSGSAFTLSSSPWLDGMAVGAGIFQPLTGNFGGDTKTDICVYVNQSGTWNVGVNTGGAFSMSPWPNGIWLDGWGVEPGSPKVTSDEPLAELPETFLLQQNYPNPFNPVTTITYSLPATAHVTLEVYNLLGQRVATLVNDNQETGEHLVTWDASHNASGIYLYRLQAGQATETKKMLLLK